MKYLILVLLIFSVSFSQDFYSCYKLFKEEKFLKAKTCFLQIKEKKLKPYKNYFISQINLLYDEKPILNKNPRYAVDSYLYLKLAGDSFYKKDFKTAKFYIDKIDEKALDKDDFPFYIYLKANIFNNISLKKLLATEYIYDRNYGYKTFVEIYKNFLRKNCKSC
ncbi:hypothetical protein [Hydrogenivirga sp. 128-5-R1-1]|uniref:hypothetical protein n=1 Tax=Hydrogenivirga sp. 128-5-R1-1 TaxID=392423 RepID=UPI00015EFCDC|nr:hypothetical protein [Hydrogenivirga sp. 128-5-R1-1]EDP73416.1 hypothetical protein HG1285_11148 [Hydrogenivirga sp. 128-5-R1-1]